VITVPRPSRWRGFTLLEMLVVVLIIGIVAAGAIISLGATGRDSQLEQERDRLEALIAYTRDRGALMSTEYGIRCGQHGYRFVYYDNLTMQWLPETLDDTLRVRRLPAGLDLRLSIEGRPIVLEDKALQYDASAAVPPPALGGMPNVPGLSSGANTASGTAAGTSSAADSPAAAVSSSPLGAPANLTAAATDNTPQIMLLSNGDTNSFVLTIERPGSRRSVTLKSQPDGSISAGKIMEVPQ
jgi:type II secretion system protein H